MESVKLLLLLQTAVLFSLLMSSCLARDFYVGGKDGWVKSPCETFNHWAERQRFRINDRLVFRYKKGEDSVLVVKKESYDSCNTTDPIEKIDDGASAGESVFRFGRSGSFFYISGERGHCRKGQKLVVVVLTDRKKNQDTSVPSPTSSIAPGPVEAGGLAESPGGSSTSSSSGSGLVASVGMVVVMASIFVSLF